MKTFAAAIVSILFAAAIAKAQPIEWQVTLPDRTISNASRITTDVDGERENMTVVGDDGTELEAVLLSRRPAAGTGRASGPHRLFLANGDAVRGDLVELTDEAIVFSTLDFGTISIPLEEAVALASVSLPRDVAWYSDRPDADVVILVNGDESTGFIEGTDEQGRLTLAEDAGGEVSLDPAAIQLLRFADAGVEAASVPSIARVLLDDGSELALASLKIAGGTAALDWRGEQIDLPEYHLWAIEPTRATVWWLADVPPTLNRQTPYLTAVTRNVQLAGLESAVSSTLGRSIVARSRSEMRFAIPAGNWTRFEANVRIDPRLGDASLADVDVRVLVDDAVRFEHRGLNANAGSLPIAIDVAGGQTLSLVVDYGQNLDAQDSVVWERPALVRGG